MHRSRLAVAGAVLLGIGDNSVSGAGTFYEGVLTIGYPTDAIDARPGPTSSRPATKSGGR